MWSRLCISKYKWEIYIQKKIFLSKFKYCDMYFSFSVSEEMYEWDNRVTSISVQCLSLCFISPIQLWTDAVVCGKSWMLYTQQRAVHMLRNSIYQPRWGAALISVQCCAELCRNVVCVCNGKGYELNVGVCSRGGDQPAIAGMLVPKGAEQELFCRSEWEEQVGAAGWQKLRPQLQHLVINKQVAELKKSDFPFICFLIFF